MRAISSRHATEVPLPVFSARISWGVLDLMKFQQDGAWVLVTILIVAQPGVHRTWRKAGDRVLGTFIGCAVALVVGIPLNGHPVALTLAAILPLGSLAT